MSRAALTRRTAIAAAGLTSVGVGGAFLLDTVNSTSANEQRPQAGSQSLTPAPTKSPGYRGDVKFTSYSGDVEAVVLGNDNAKAKNVPAPQEPHGMTEPNVEGLYSFIGFWVAAHNYLLLTGDASALNKVTDAQSQEDAKELGELYAKGAWLRSSTAHPFTLSLDTEQPTKGESENTYIWKCTPGFDPQARMVGAANTIYEDFKSNFAVDTDPLFVVYDQGSWRMTYDVLPETRGKVPEAAAGTTAPA